MIKQLRYALEAALVYAVYGFFAVLPVARASGIGGALGRFVGPLLPASKKARENIRATFPDADIEKILTGMWDNLGRVIAEYPHLHEIASERVDLEGREHIAPGIYVGGHIGNWEASCAIALAGDFGMHVVYRRPNNPWVAWLLERARRRAGVAGAIAKGASGAKEIFSVLRKRGSVGMLMDQRLGEGIPVPFFGRDAMTSTAPAVFGRKLGCALIPTKMERLPDARFRLTLYPPIFVGEEDDATVMRRVNAYLEEWITANPAQWLWLHNRWR